METYELNIVRFMRDHRDYVIKAGPSGVGYTAQLRGSHGHGVGPRYTDTTLDGLTGQLADAERAAQAPETP